MSFFISCSADYDSINTQAQTEGCLVSPPPAFSLPSRPPFLPSAFNSLVVYLLQLLFLTKIHFICLSPFPLIVIYMNLKVFCSSIYVWKP